ncbi:MAG: tetraacyldisaccharide 4'-kinase [Pseudomonadota bacterium]
MSRWLYAVWYEQARGGFLLWPLEGLFRAIAFVRRLLFRMGALKAYSVDAHIVVVGNIAVGGAGKSPLTAWLASELTRAGYRVAIVSGGYGGNARGAPLLVTDNTEAALCGDEAKMLAQSTGVPVYVSRDRVAACVRASLDGAQIVLCDDGLQHYRLRRDVEIAVVDGERLHGNGHCLPAGPLREPVRRLDAVDLVVYNGGSGRAPSFELHIDEAINIETGARKVLSDFAGARVHAFAGIGHPQRFFKALRAHGLTVNAVSLGDHALASEQQRHPAEPGEVLMTDKDAVKYADLTARHWRVPATLLMSESDVSRVLAAVTPPAPTTE